MKDSEFFISLKEKKISNIFKAVFVLLRSVEGTSGVGEEEETKNNAVWLHHLSKEAQQQLVKGNKKHCMEIPRISLKKVARDIWTTGNTI